MTYEEIAAMLAAGKSGDDIAKEFTDTLNKAVADKKAAEEEAAKAKNDAKSKKMDEISIAIAHALNEYAHLAGVECDPMRGAEVREMLDQFLPVIESLKGIKVYVANGDAKPAKAAVAKKILRTPDDIFSAFFKENGWI